MKKQKSFKILSLSIFAAFLFLFIISKFSSAAALPSTLPNPQSGGVVIGVVLNGTSNPNSYSVTATHVVGGSTQSVNFSYKTAGGNAAFYSDTIKGIGNGCPTTGDASANASALAANTFTITAKNGSGTWSTNYSACSDQVDYIYYTGLTVSGSGQATGSVSGTVFYKDQNGASQPFDNSTGTASGQLSGPNGASYSLVFGSDATGNFSKIPNLPPGAYTFVANFVPTNPDDPGTKTYNQSFNLAAGQSFIINGNVACTSSSTTVCSTGTTAASAASADQQSQIDANCTISLNPLTWLICPIVSAADKLIDELDTQINNLLDVNGCDYFNPSGNQNNINTNPQTGSPCTSSTNKASNGYYAAWQSLRNISMAIVVIAALIMVISQALGFEVFDAYTIKKVLPRMLIAIIGITLSWEIVQVLVQVSDDIGVGVRYIIYAPFQSFGNVQFNSLGSSALALLGGVALLGLGLIGLLSFVVTAALAVGIAFALLIFREIFIIFFAIFAPVAIACFILPGTEKVWKFWWSNFTKALIMFPIISAMIAIGRVYAATVTGNNTNPGIVAEVTAMVAYFGPYFLIPATFRMSGTILSAAGNFAQKATKAAGQPLANFRKNQRAQRAERAAKGNLWRGNNKLATFGNSLAQGAVLAPKAGLNPANMAAKMKAARTQAEFDHAMELMDKSPEFAAIKNDDTLLRATQALAHGDTEEAKRIIASDPLGRYTDAAQQRQALATADAARRTGSVEAIDTAATMALAGTGTGYSNAGDMLTAIKNSAGGDSSKAARMLGAMKGMASQSGRVDLGGAGYGTLSRELTNAMNGQKVDTDSINIDAFTSNDAVTVGRGRNEGVSNITASIAQRITQLDEAAKTRTLSAAESQERGRLVAGLENLGDTSKQYAAPQRVQTIQTEISNTREERRRVAGTGEEIKIIHSQVASGEIDAADLPGTSGTFSQEPNTPDRMRAKGNVASAYEEQRQQRFADPNNPNNLPPPDAKK